MPSPITPPSYPITDADRLYLAENLPKLAANPSLLQIVNDSIKYVGETFQNIVGDICQGMYQCQNVTDDCFAKIVEEYGAHFDNLGLDGNTVFNAFHDDLNQIAQTCFSGVNSTIDNCQTTIAQALQELPIGCYLRIEQYIPIKEPVGWNYIQPWEVWRSIPTIQYILDSNGQIAWGVRLNPDYSIDYHGGSNVPSDPEPGNFDDEQLIWSSNPINQPDTGNCSDYMDISCVTPPPDKGIISPPIVSPPWVPINPISVPPSSTGTLTPPPKPISTGGSCNTNVTCPNPVVNVNVSPTPVTINVQPCQPTPPATETPKGSGTEVTTTEPGKPGDIVGPDTVWEPNVKDTVEQLLDALGFPQDFIVDFGETIHGEMSMFRDNPQSIRNLIPEELQS